MKRFGKIMFRLFLALVVVVLAAVGVACVLLASPKGLPWLVAGVERLVPGFTVQQVSGRFFSSWSLADISYRRGGFSVAVDALRLRWRGQELPHGLIVIDELAVAGIRLALPPASAPAGRSQGRKKAMDKGSAWLSIPSWLRLRLDKLAIADARLSRGGRETLVLESVSGGGRIGAGTVRLKDWRLAGKMAADTAEPIAFAVNLEDISMAGLLAATTARPATRIGLRGQISLSPGRGFAPVRGTLTIDGTLAKPELSLRLAAPVPLTLFAGAEQTDGHWHWHGGLLSGLSGEAISLSAVNANWRPMQISLKTEVFGLDAHYEATVSGAAAMPDRGDGRFALTLASDAGGLTLKECRLDGAFGVLHAKGSFAWKDGFSWQGEIEADGFNPAFFASDYAGALNVALTTSGSIAGDSRVGDLKIDTLSGQVRGYPVAGGGGLHFSGATLAIESLSLRSGQARLDMAGSIAEQIEITADVAIPDLSEVLAAAGGGLEARVALTGAVTQPRLAARVKGRDLSFGKGRDAGSGLDLALGLLTADFTGIWTTVKPEDSSFSGQFQAERLDKSNQRLLDSLKLSLDGSLAEHQAGLSVKAPLGEAAIHFAGGMKEKSWSGAIDSLSLAGAGIGRWQQNGAARLTLAADKSDLTGLVITGGDGGLRMSGGFAGEGAERFWRFAASDGKLPLSLFPALAPSAASQEDQRPGRRKVDRGAGGTASGTANGTNGIVAFAFSAEGNGSRLVQGQLSARTGQANLPGIPVLPGFQRIRLSETSLDIAVNGGLLSLGVASHFNGDHDLSANLALAAPDGVFDLKNLFALTQAPLSGTLRLNMADINFVGPVSHYTTMPSGAVAADFVAGGTPIHPRLTGKVTMPDNGQVEITSSGIDIKDVRIDAVIGADLAGLLAFRPSTEERRTGGEDGLTLDLTVHGSSGPGHATAVGVLKFPWAAPFFGDFSLVGNDCEIFRRPEYRIRGNPDVRMFFNRTHGKLTGAVAVTSAEIAPEQIQDSVGASSDLVIADEKEESPGWRFLTDLRIDLGDQVRFTGYGLTGLLRGNLLVKTDESGHFMGQGALQLADGGFTIYGRRLQIERGRLSFNGGAIDDPLLDARAQKQVLTKGAGVHEIVVGVDVSGSAHDPEFQLFSSEPLGDREILTYLLSGTSASNDAPDESLLSSAAKALGLDDQANLLGGMGLFDEVSLERNETDNSMSLMVGKRLTDDLFIGYDQNFVGDGSGAFKIRYNLGRGFMVETRSSGSISSADLFYSFEK